ncbi:MAG: hypothetical protein AAFQ64_09980 [Pseudomonadota bacterium]
MAAKLPPAPVYLARKSYRQRRIRDAARMLPLVGAVLWVMPVMYVAPATSTTGLLIFGIWVVLIIFAAVISSRITLGPNEIDKASLGQDGD